MDAGIMARVTELLGQSEAYSRNRHFEEFQSERGKRVLRLYRLYRALLNELERASSDQGVKVSAKAESGGVMVTLERDKPSYKRYCLVPGAMAQLFADRLSGLDVTLKPRN